nr:hypothetical protein [Tanacetum cinerariifolium]
MKSIQTFLEEFNYIPFGEKPKILLEAWDKFFTIQRTQLEDSNELFQKLLEDLKELAEEECYIEVCEEQKQNMENTILELVEICHQKELLCMHDNVDDLIESALKSKLLSINSQRPNKEHQEVKNVVEQPAERRTRIEKSLHNFRVIHKSSTSLNNTSQISPVHAVTPILSTKEPEYSPNMGYEHPNTTPEMEPDEIIKSGVEELVSILSENDVTSENKRECDVPVYENSPVCNDHSEIFSDSNNDDDISSDEDTFKDIEYVEASLPDPEIVSVEEENVVHQEDEEFDLEEIQDVILREKLLSTNRLIPNIESLNDNPTPNCVLNSFVLILLLKSPIILFQIIFRQNSKLFAIIRKRREVVTPLLMLMTLFPNMIRFTLRLSPIKRGDIRFLQALLIDDSIPFLVNESSEYDVDNPSVPRPPPEPLDVEFELNSGEEILVVIDELECIDPKDEFDDDDYSSFMFVKVISFLLSAESEDTIFNPGISI